MELSILVVSGMMFMCTSALRCYHGANVAFAESSLRKTIRVVECGPLASFCRRAYGLINGKEGWILSCMAKTSLGADYCKNGSECTAVTSGSGNTSSHYMDCCCSNDMCNDESLKASPEQINLAKLSKVSSTDLSRLFHAFFIGAAFLILHFIS